MTSVPHAPWTLTGECVAGLARFRGARPALPEGVSRMPGPCLVVAAAYADSPVGSYFEMAFGVPARLGARPGWCLTTMAVSSTDARVGGRLNWGFPKELATLRWSADGDTRRMDWFERGITIVGVPTGPPVPAFVPLRNLQRRADGPVVIPARLSGRARFGRVTIETVVDDPLAGLAGRHRGVVVHGMKFVVSPARLPSGLMSTLLAPLRAPEPAMSSPAAPAA
ncbi:MAG: hypothetical protein JWO37_434 [Acidimicrobiales bacterium]|nr:hypothetical protein [Acidimicrobiales bacterium]